MARWNHISVLLALGGITLPGCIKKSSKDREPSATAQETTTSDPRDLVSLDLHQSKTKLSIVDPLAGLASLGSWRPMSREQSPLPCPYLTKVFWSGSHLVVFGQQKTGTISPSCQGLVSLWDPLTDTWKSLPDAGLATLKDSSLESAEVFLAGGQLHVILPKAAESMALDLAGQTWKKAPEWISTALWAPAETKDAPSTSARIQGEDTFIPSSLRSYVPLPAGLAVWVDSGVKLFDWQSGASKDLPPIPWPPGSNSALSQDSRSFALKSQALDQSVMAYHEANGRNAPASSVSAFALASVLSNPFSWRIVSPPVLVDEHAKPKCADTNGSFATLVESRLVLIGTDSVQNEPQPIRTCISTVDTLTGAMTNSIHLTLSQIAGRSDGSYEYLDLSISAHALSGRKLVYRLKRDGGIVSISDESSQGFAFQGHDERFLVYDSQSGLAHVTPPMVGSNSLEKVYLLGTDRGIIVWGGYRPKPDGTDEGINEGMVLDWPL
jgi:hypothetical protein